MKVTTNFKQGEALFHLHAQFITRAYEFLGITIYVETIAGGAIFFYRSLEDYKKFHEFAKQVHVLSKNSLERPTSQQEIPYFVTNVFVRRPPNAPMELLLEIMERAHRRISPRIEFKLIPPNTILMQYKTEGDFSQAFRFVGDALGKKITPPYHIARDT